jgi:small subunit ribosomal protein S7
VSKTQQVLLAHGRWSMENLNVNDPGLKRYICVKPVAVFHTGGRHEHRRFGKVSVPIVERLINKMMHPGKNMGKKHLNTNIALQALEIIHLRTKENPLQVLIRAIENSALREETTRIAYGGIVYHQSVDISPLRRLDIALKHMADGARAAAFSKPKTIEECLADEILLAASYDSKSFAVARREELERIALSAR